MNKASIKYLVSPHAPSIVQAHKRNLKDSSMLSNESIHPNGQET